MFLIILGIGVVLRAFLHADRFPRGGVPEPLYYEAITQHFLEYVWVSHTVLPMVLIRDWVLFHSLPADLVGDAILVLIYLVNSAAAGFVLLALRQLAMPAWLAVGVALVITIRLTTWDVYFARWDYFNPFLVSLLIWSAVSLVRAPTTKSALWAGMSGALFALSYQTAVPVVVSMLVVAVLVGTFPRIGLRPLVAAVVLPLAVTAFLVTKNGTQYGVYAPSTGAGQNIVQNLNLAIVDGDDQGVLNLAKANGYPDWWVWCYETAEKIDPYGQANLAGFYGSCNRDKEFGYDYGPLKDYVAANPDTEIAWIVALDIERLENTPWMLAGAIGDRASGFSAVYGRVSSQVLGDVARMWPRNLMGRTFLNSEIFVAGVGTFGIDFDHRRVVWPQFLLATKDILAPVLSVSVLLTLAFAGLFPLFALLLSSKKLPEEARLSVADGVVWAMSLGFFFGTVGSVVFHCCENARHAFNLLPMIAVTSGYIAYRTVHILSILRRTRRSSMG